MAAGPSAAPGLVQLLKVRVFSVLAQGMLFKENWRGDLNPHFLK